MRFSRFLTATAVAVLPGAGWAQGAIELEEAFVFSGLLPVEVNRTGTSVEVLDGDEIETGGVGVAQTLNRVPGVAVASNGGLGTETGVTIRGLSGYYTGVTFDGIEVTDPSATQNLFNFGQLTRGGVGRIEVAKGAQTAVYGSDAIGGAINITSWRPVEEGLSWGAAVEAGSYGSLAASLRYGFLDADTEIAWTLSRTRTDGFSAREEDSEADGFRQTFLSFSFREEVSDVLAVGGSFFFADEVTEYDNPNFAPPPAVVPEGGSDGVRAGWRVFAEIDAGGIRHEIAVSDYRRDRVEDFGGGFTLPFTGDRAKVEYVGTTDIGAATRLAFGADWSEEDYTSGGDAGSSSNGGVFGEIQHAMTDATDLSLALRQDVYSDFANPTTGRLALVHRGAGGLTYRASLATGYRAPSLYERFAGFGVGNPALEPEESLGGEIGVEKAFGNGAVAATLFHTEIENRIDYSFITSSYAQVPGVTTTKGLELSGEVALGAASVYGAYTYTEAETAGTRANRVPRHDLVLGVEMPFGDAIEGWAEVQVVRDVLDFGTPLDDYTLVGIGASYALSDRMEAYVRVENLFDEQYQTVRTYNTAGRSVFAGLRAAF